MPCALAADSVDDAAHAAGDDAGGEAAQNRGEVRQGRQGAHDRG